MPLNQELEIQIKEAKSRTKNKFVIVLGSGFHKIISEPHELLSDWSYLLKVIKPTFESTGNYLLDFEKILIERNGSDSLKQKVLMASEKEKELLKVISTKINEAQKEVLSNSINSYPPFIFNPDFVSDVICLNFDTIAEEVCRYNYKPESIKRGFVKLSNDIEQSLLHLTTRYTEFSFSGNRKLRFWHPHGSITKPTSIILSARKYAQHIGVIERLRKHSKSKERNTNDKNTWYDALTHNPVLIIGASISAAEWDIWSAFVNRERNFSKPNNKIHRKPVFQMRSTENGKYPIDKTNQEWFNNLFNDNIPYHEQWLALENLLKC
jgi:hypothetical protein